MTHQLLKQRAAVYARQVTTLTRPLLKSLETRDVALQLRRAANAVAANYRSTGLARSHKEFIARIGVVVEESDECIHWLEHLRATLLTDDPDLEALEFEARHLTRIFAASYRTARRQHPRHATRR